MLQCWFHLICYHFKNLLSVKSSKTKKQTKTLPFSPIYSIYNTMCSFLYAYLNFFLKKFFSRNTNRIPVLVYSPNACYSEASWGWSQEPGPQSRSPCWWHGTNCLTHDLLQLRVCTDKRLDLGMEVWEISSPVLPSSVLRLRKCSESNTFNSLARLVSGEQTRPDQWKQAVYMPLVPCCLSTMGYTDVI